MAKTWLTALTGVHRVPIFGRIAAAVAALTLYSIVVVVIESRLAEHNVKIQSNVYTLLGAVISLLLVFRTNTAYDRWWEGRKLWGRLVNDSRNLALKVAETTPATADERARVARLIGRFANELRDSLREGEVSDETTIAPRSLDEPPKPTPHRPIETARSLVSLVFNWYRENKIDGYVYLSFERQVSALMEVCGACERIRKTPISSSYIWFCRQSIGVYLLILPIAMAQEQGWATVPAMMFVGYFMIGLETMAEVIEQPFGFDEDDLDLEGICETIRRSAEQILNKSST